jgi:hypothetical protein
LVSSSPLVSSTPAEQNKGRKPENAHPASHGSSSARHILG